MIEVEKSFKAFNVSEAMKMPLAEFQLKKFVNEGRDVESSMGS